MAKFIQKLLFATLTLLTAYSVNADDIDILNEEALIDANVLFVMDLSGSMNKCISPSSGDDDDDDCSATRLSELSGAFQDIVNDTDFEEVNFGLSVFSGAGQSSRGASVAHGVTYPVSPVMGTNAQSILSKTGYTHPGVSPDDSYMPAAGINDTRQYLSLLSSDSTIWSANGSTPIVDALFEAARYFRGESVHFGRFVASDIRSAHPATYNGSLSLSTSTVTPACTAATRIYCTQGSCGPTESCAAIASTTISATDTGSCTVNTGNTVYCPTGQTSCGLGTGCSEQSWVSTRYCGTTYTTISSCMAANPTWHSCQTYVHTETVINSENQSVSTSTTRVRCQEDFSRYRCDAADNYACPTTFQSCTKCPDDVVDTAVTGSAIYKSPITSECQKNGIILLTDGQPTENTSADLVTTMIGSYSQGCQYAPSPGTETQVYGRCGRELAKFLAEEDHADGSTSTPNIDGDQSVNTYTVGLSLPAGSEAADYLNEVAIDGGGSYVTANNRAELTEAFKSAILGIAGNRARSFAAPTYSIDTSTLLSHGGEVYIPLFDRDGVVWPGNLKKFTLSNMGQLLDKNNVAATDADGNLLPTAIDLWSDDSATGELTSGGAANKINSATRVIKTDNVISPAITGSLVTLDSSIANNAFGLDDSSTADTALKGDLVKYIKGINPADDSIRHHMGDIIHSKPVKLNVAGGENIIFVGTNEGYLHAIKDSDGTEVFAYMPRELLDNIKDQYQKNITPKHIYGVDGQLTLWLDESANTDYSQVDNNVLDVAGGERAYLFFGLRRGGQHYHALEVTNPAAPTLVWKKTIGTGDSWSQPVVTKIKDDSDNYFNAIVVGGGYNEDVATGNELAGGNAVHIVRADTGADVWDTSIADSSAISNAIPSRIRVIDLDRNGLADRLYFGDTGGNIWRVDLNAGNYSTTTSDYGKLSKAKLYKVASLGASGSDAENRKFFEEPDVAVFRQAGKFVATIAIGSGDRTKPLDSSVDDRFFLLYDKQVMVKPATTTPLITMDSSTGGLKASSDVVASDLSSATFRGWHKELNGTGEKVLASAVTFQNKLLFTTFATVTNTPDACTPTNTNQSKLYIMDLLTGSVDKNIIAATGEILGEPQINFGELKNKVGNSCVLGTDTNCKRNITARTGRVGPITLPTPAAGTTIPDALPRIYWIDN